MRSARARAALHLPLALLLAILVRYPFWVEALRTPVDGDTAIVGLMARHPLESGTTLLGQPYGSPLEAWTAAPFFAALGARPSVLRLVYFLLGLGLVPLAYFLAGALNPRAALPAAILLACPPPYLLLLSALPPPLYPSALVLGGLLLVLTLRVERRVAEGRSAIRATALLGLIAGLSLWNHLMAASVVAACGGYLLLRVRRRVLWPALPGLLLGSAPFWQRALRDPWAMRIVSLSGRQQSLLSHLGAVVPALGRPILGLLGTHVPVIADDPTHVVWATPFAALGLVLLYGLALVLAVRASRRHPPAGLLLAAVVLAVVAFPFPLRSGAASIRYLSLLYLPLGALVAWVPLAGGRVSETRGGRRAFVLVLALACLNLSTGSRLLATWRETDRAAAPFLLPDLAPVARALEARGLHHVYASYGPAYRLSFETGERILATQPWNERFRHYPLPFLDEVRFAKDVAWVLTPGIPTDLPPPRPFEAALSAAGGHWQRFEAGPATVFEGFTPPFGASVEPWPGAGALGDGDLATSVEPPPGRPLALALPAARRLDAVTLVAPLGPLRLPRDLDVEVSPDGASFEVVARRRPRQERQDLRWVNGQPQYVLDHDLLAIPLGGRSVRALRLVARDPAEAWALGEVLIHPAEEPSRRQPWSEWLDPHLGWAERRAALAAHPLREREDWYYRMLLAARH